LLKIFKIIGQQGDRGMLLSIQRPVLFTTANYRRATSPLTPAFAHPSPEKDFVFAYSAFEPRVYDEILYARL